MVVRVRCSGPTREDGPYAPSAGGRLGKKPVGLRQTGEHQAQGAVRPHRTPHEPLPVGHDVRNPDKAITPIEHPTRAGRAAEPLLAATSSSSVTASA